MTTTPQATGRRDGDWIVWTRHFTAPVEVVWAAITEPDRLARWIGTWTGDPRTGRVLFHMTAEGDDVPPETYDIDVCEPPQRLHVTTTDVEGGTWHLRLELTGDGERTRLDFAQQLSDPDLAASVGPGWDYYLDRLVTAETDGDVGAVDFDDYYPGLSAHYRALFA